MNNIKTIKNDVQNIVEDMLQGFYFEYKDRVYYDSKHHIIYRKDLGEIGQNVVLLSGGGAAMNLRISVTLGTECSPYRLAEPYLFLLLRNKYWLRFVRWTKIKAY